VADEVRALAAAAVAETLGLDAPQPERIRVDVSVGDVTSDPRLL
jgi:hypothetical protein